MRAFGSGADRVRLLVQLAVTLAGIGVCLLLEPVTALAVAAVSITVFFADFWVRKREVAEISAVCDKIDLILRGSEDIVFDDYREGALSILSAEVQKMTVRLREQNADLRREHGFMKTSLEDISHQLRTPLTSMMLVIGMLRSPDLDRRQQAEYLQELLSLISRMQWLIETLLELSRLDAGAVTFRTETVSVRELVRKSFEPFEVAAELKNISFEGECSTDITVQGDFQYLCEALGNVFKNCIEHTPEGGSICVAAEDNPLFTGLTVTDSGEGISNEDLPHIFERFYRSSEFARNGYGIGLAFAQRVVAMHNGCIQARSALPHGAAFEMRFYKTTV
jgi:signal transduction histidine kinase